MLKRRADTLDGTTVRFDMFYINVQGRTFAKIKIHFTGCTDAVVDMLKGGRTERPQKAGICPA